MKNTQKKILISAGEASGDLHGSNLIKATKSIDPKIQFYGMGSDLIQQTGAKVIVNSRSLGIFGGYEIITSILKIWRAFKIMKAALLKDKPDLLILVDYPGFNLRLAKIAKKAGVNVLYYISPKVWAWNQSRVSKIKQYVDRMAVIFPFEVDFYKQYKIPATFVGNPLIDNLPSKISNQKARDILNIDTETKTVGLFPGSRLSEIKRLLPVILESAKILKKTNSKIQFILPKANSISYKILEHHLNSYKELEIKVITDQNYNVMQACDAIIAASGTVTLEIALMEIPLVIIYKLAKIEYLIAKNLIKIPHVGLCNILSGRKFVQELLQNKANAQEISSEINKILNDSTYREQMLTDLKNTKKILTTTKKKNIASLIIETLKL